jgi:hypothetical protein
LCLREMPVFAEFPQQSTQLFLAWRAQSVAHSVRPRSKKAASPHNPSSGLSHFGIIFGLLCRNVQSGREFDRCEGVR